MASSTPAKNKSISEFGKFGREVGETDRAFARLALLACKAAEQGDIGPEDAIHALMEFQEERDRASGAPRRSGEPHKVQVSKLRRFMVLGSEIKGASSMLEFVAEQYSTHATTTLRDGQKPLPEYDAMLRVARAATADHKHLSKKAIIEILAEP